MSRLYELIQQAKTRDLESIQEIMDRFDPKIKSASKLTKDCEREDLEQELRIHVFKAVDKFKTAETPGFREFISHLSKQRSSH